MELNTLKKIKKAIGVKKFDFLDVELVACYSRLCQNYLINFDEEEALLICNFSKEVYRQANYEYVYIIIRIVTDLYMNLYLGYYDDDDFWAYDNYNEYHKEKTYKYNEKFKHIITKEDLINFDQHKINLVINFLKEIGTKEE